MKITIEHYDETISIETKYDDLTISEYMDLIKRLSISIYSEELVNQFWDS